MSNPVTPTLSSIIYTPKADYIPGFSTGANIKCLFEKYHFRNEKLIDHLHDHEFKYIKDKSTLRCLVGCIPVLGNIILGFYDLFTKSTHSEEIKKEEFLKRKQEFRALWNGAFFAAKDVIEVQTKLKEGEYTYAYYDPKNVLQGSPYGLIITKDSIQIIEFSPEECIVLSSWDRRENKEGFFSFENLFKHLKLGDNPLGVSLRELLYPGSR